MKALHATLKGNVEYVDNVDNCKRNVIYKLIKVDDFQNERGEWRSEGA